MLSAPLCCHSVDTGDIEVPDSKTESGSRERVAHQPEQRRQKVRRDVSDDAAAPSSPVHSTLGQVRMERLVYVFHPVSAGAAFMYYMCQLFSG